MTRCGLAVVAALVVGCGGGHEEERTSAERVAPAGEATPLFTEGQGARIVHAVAYDTAWSFGGAGDTLLDTPARMAVAPDGGVYLLDLGADRVLRIAAGRLAWSWGKSGQGPEELGNARAMAVDVNTNGPVLVDSGNRRIVWLSSDGVLLREQPFAGNVLTTEDMVALSDGSGYVASTFGMDGINLLHVSRDGENRTPVTPEWSGFRNFEWIQLDMALFAGRGDLWGLGFKTGNGFFVATGDSVRPHPYVEHTDFHEVAVRESAGTKSIRFVDPTRRNAAHDADTLGDTLFVLASASDGPRVLDLYSLPSGVYVESRSLPGRTASFAMAGDTVFVVDVEGLLPTVSALVPRLVPP